MKRWSTKWYIEHLKSMTLKKKIMLCLFVVLAIIGLFFGFTANIEDDAYNPQEPSPRFLLKKVLTFE